MRKIILTGAVLAMLTSAAPMVHAQVDPGVQAKLDEKADKDAGNIEISKWQTKLGDGENKAGNTGLVTGGTLNKALEGEITKAKNELEGKVGKVDSLDEKINNIQKDLDGRIAANEKLLNGDNVKVGLNKELADIKNIVGEDDKKGLQKKVYDLEKAKLGYDIAIQSLNAAVRGNNGNGGLENDFEDLKKVVGKDATEGLQKDVKENKKLLVGDNGKSGLQKDVEDLKRVVGENDTEGLQKSVKENTNKITQAENNAQSAKDESAAASRLALEVKQKIDAMANGQNDVKKDIAELGGRINVTGAMSAALAGLKPLQYDPMAPTQVMGSVSTYEGQQAYALGLAHFTSEDLMVHGGVSFTNSHKYMANVGVTYKFGHSAEKSMIPMRYQAGPISSIYVMQKENEMMREKMAQQEERIAQLEEMIMNMKK